MRLGAGLGVGVGLGVSDWVGAEDGESAGTTGTGNCTTGTFLSAAFMYAVHTAAGKPPPVTE